MPKITNLKQAVQVGKSVAAQASGQLEELAGAAGKGAFSVSAGPNGVSISANFNELIKKKTSGNRIASPIKELYQNDKNKESLIYPPDLDNEHFIIFKVMKERRLRRTDKREIATYQNIVLPVPSNLGVQYSAQYSDKSLGAFGAMAAGKVGAADLSNAATALGDIISNKIAAATQAFKTKDSDAAAQGLGLAAPAIATGAATKLAGPLGGLLALGGTSDGVVAGISVSEGLALNPHMAVVFEGIGFRTHQFKYKFMARDGMESDTIKRIINTFQYYMHPSYAVGSLAFQYPEEFEIEFADSISPYLYDIGTCVLKDFSVNYNGEGIPLFFEHTGAPVSIEIDMTFQETHIITKERLKNRVED